MSPACLGAERIALLARAPRRFLSRVREIQFGVMALRLQNFGSFLQFSRRAQVRRLVFAGSCRGLIYAMPALLRHTHFGCNQRAR